MSTKRDFDNSEFKIIAKRYVSIYGETLEKEALSHPFGEGAHTVSVMDPTGRKRPANVTFQIIRKENSMQE